MIVVIIEKDRVRVKGHANFSEHGKDIVCAGVSALLCTLKESIEVMTNSLKYAIISPGNSELQFYNDETTRILLKSFEIGVKLIAETYPENVTLTADSR